MGIRRGGGRCNGIRRGGGRCDAEVGRVHGDQEGRGGGVMGSGEEGGGVIQR